MSAPLAVIPSRYAAQRFPGKPLTLISGKPIVQHVVQRCLEASCFSRVVVATDDQRIADVCVQAGIRVAMTRSDHATGTDRLSEVVTQLGLADDAVVVNVQGDEPLIPASVINHVAALLQRQPGAAMATLCHPIHDVSDAINPNVVKCALSEAGEALYFSRAPIPYARDDWSAGMNFLPLSLPMYRHIGLYAFAHRFYVPSRR